MPNLGQQHSIEKSRQLQRNLYLAAKKDKQRRFHALYDRIFRLDILWRAWKGVRENKGSAGIDGITIEMIEEYGVEDITQRLTPVYGLLFLDNSYGYRPGRDAKDAITKVKEYAEQGYTHAVALDLSKYFDTLNHEKLLNILRRNVKDERVILRNLKKLGIPEYFAKIAANSRKAYWFTSNTTTVKRALSKQRLINSGFYDLATAYQSVHVNY